MATVARFAEIPAEVLADLEEVCRHVMSGGVRDPELLLRIHERGEAVTREILERHGELNIAVDLIRETRDEE